MSEASRRVLIAEPNPLQQKIFRGVLKPEENGWELLFASSATEVMEKHLETPIDIIVSVNQLKDCTGSELFESLRDSAPEIIRLLLIDEAEKRAMRSPVSSAQQILLKPLALPPFIKQINRSLALRAVVHDPAILAFLGDANTLPPLPRVFQQLTQKLNDPNSSLTDIGEMIAQDIVLSSKILQLANSALFSLRVPAQNVTHAVSLLGSSAVSSLVFSQSVFNSFKGSAATEAFFEELNRHSIECATLTAKILHHWGAGREIIDKSLFCGIAHDLGKLVLARYAPEKWTAVQQEYMRTGRPDIELEREIIGVSHTDLTAYLLTVWGFSNDQILAIVFHHEPSRVQESEFGLLCALHIAENCCLKPGEKPHFDETYLNDCRITPEELAGFRFMYEDEVR
jgi:HD-like signal output (HDOD) protein